MTFEAYVNTDFTIGQKILFFVISFLGLAIVFTAICVFSKIKSKSVQKSDRKNYFYETAHNLTQRFMEMIISATSVMTFACAYIILNHIYSLACSMGGAKYKGFISFWENGKDFILLLLICISCLLNTLFDRIIIRLKAVTREEIASLRLLSMFYVILILLFLNRIGDESEYSPVMLYYLGLMIGRFVYFDASFTDFVGAMKNAFKNILLLVLGLVLVGGLSFYGFNAGYLLERNYYIVGVYYTQLFILLGVFVVHNARLIYLFVKKPKNYDEQWEYETGDEYSEDEELLDDSPVYEDENFEVTYNLEDDNDFDFM